jgi:hypothetical protein
VYDVTNLGHLLNALALDSAKRLSFTLEFYPYGDSPRKETHAVGIPHAMLVAILEAYPAQVLYALHKVALDSLLRNLGVVN